MLQSIAAGLPHTFTQLASTVLTCTFRTTHCTQSIHWTATPAVLCMHVSSILDLGTRPCCPACTRCSRAP
jgi:hypothetical protein